MSDKYIERVNRAIAPIIEAKESAENAKKRSEEEQRDRQRRKHTSDVLNLKTRREVSKMKFGSERPNNVRYHEDLIFGHYEGYGGSYQDKMNKRQEVLQNKKGYLTEVINNANKKLTYGVKEGDTGYSLSATGLYEAIDKANVLSVKLADRTSVKNRLVRAYEKEAKEDPEKALARKDAIIAFLKRHPSKERGLEHHVSAAVLILVGIASLFFLSSNLTGNVIGNMSQTSSNWVGGVLFIIGLVGAFLYFRNK